MCVWWVGGAGWGWGVGGGWGGGKGNGGSSESVNVPGALCTARIYESELEDTRPTLAMYLPTCCSRLSRVAMDRSPMSALRGGVCVCVVCVWGVVACGVVWCGVVCCGVLMGVPPPLGGNNAGALGRTRLG